VRVLVVKIDDMIIDGGITLTQYQVDLVEHPDGLFSVNVIDIMPVLLPLVV
jgi:hypothetical protein